MPKMLQICECGEPLVALSEVCPDLIIALSSKRIKREKTAYLRKTVVEMVCRAKTYLPNGMTFIIGDAWRPQCVQREIFQTFIKRFRKEHPSWSESKIEREAGKYAAPWRGKYASGHMSGAAVDLRLWKNGRKVPMKSSKLTYQENAKSFQPKLPKHIQKNREIMFSALEKAGFSNYGKEYWHWSYGDIWWAKRNKKKAAFYGVVENLNYSRD